MPAASAPTGRSVDVALLGKGPSALALASALHDRGLSVAMVAPAHNEPRTLAMFEDEARGLPVRARMKKTVVDNGLGALDLERAYVVLDTDAMDAALPKDIVRVTGAAVAVGPAGNVMRVALAGGGIVDARAVVDCTGSGRFVKTQRAKPSVQTAYGVVVDGDLGLAEPGTAVLMDWSHCHDAPPSFLYVLDLGEGRFLFEETALVAQPAVPVPLLQERLMRRLRGTGRPLRILEEEEVYIPMGTGLPLRGQRVAAFGASAGLVHPATGYSVAQALRLAPDVATALAGCLARGDEAHAGDAVLDALWTSERRWARRLLTACAMAARHFSPAVTRSFFHTFFQLPREEWTAWLANDLSMSRIAVVSLRLFFRAEAPIRAAMVRMFWAPLLRTPPAALYGVSSAPREAASASATAEGPGRSST